MSQPAMYMDKLVHEADARFCEKFDAVKNREAINLTGHHAMLDQDAHFMEMKRLYSMLAGLLKGLLRECVSSSSDLCKINIEKAWNWYKDKKKELLDEKIARREKRDTAAGDAAAAGGPSAPHAPIAKQPHPPTGAAADAEAAAK
eukprot:gene33802-20357_t